MDSKTQQRYELKAKIFKALAHPMRIYILDLLQTHPYCVCELAEKANIEKSVASKHLTQLKDAGLIDDIKKGTQVEYRLIAPCILEMASCAESTILENKCKRLGITR